MKATGDDAVICEPLRTPIGRYGGSLKGLSAAELGAQLLGALIQRTGLKGSDIDDVILGHAYPTSEAPGLGRVVALDAGLPVSPIEVMDRMDGRVRRIFEAARALPRRSVPPSRR